MNSICPNCRAASSSTARFCRDCGTSLDATTTEGRTVVMTPAQTGSVALSKIDVKTIVDRARASFGRGKMFAGPIAAVPHGHCQPEDTFLGIDHSGSMGEDLDPGVTKLEGAVRGAITLVQQKDQIDPNDRIGIMEFNARADVLLDLCPVGPRKRDIIQTLQSIRVGGGTDINEPVVAARDNFDWGLHDVVRRLVLLTDGHGGNPLGTAQDLKDRGVVIDVIAVGPSPSAVNERLLQCVASVVDGEIRYRFIKDHRTLIAHYTQLANKTRTST